MRILITAAIHVARALYAVLELFGRRHKVVMLSRQADTPSKDFTLLAEELRRQDPAVEIVVRCRFIGPTLLQRTAYLGEVLIQMYHLATSRACVLDGYSVPLSILNHRGELYVVQLWHALGAIKRFGYQAVGQPGGRSAAVARAMHMHRNYDVVLCGGPMSVDVFAAAFDVDPRSVLPLGLPRVDHLRQAQAEHDSGRTSAALATLRQRHPRLADTSKTVVLYAPTFRWHRGSAYQEVISAFSADPFTLVVKPHDLESAAVGGAHVVDATGIDVLDLLPLCDVVVTDYSAVAFEAACIVKPVYFYVHDIDDYREAPGLNIDPLEVLPQMASRDLEELVGWISRLDYNADAAAAFREGYAPARDAVCTPEIARLILSRLPVLQ
jgi:CDP-ribitol ribitolphosphotransferase